MDYIYFLADIQRSRYNWLRGFLLGKVRDEFVGKSTFITLNTWEEYNGFVGTNPKFEEGHRFRKLEGDYEL